MESKQEWAKEAQRKELSKQGLVEKPKNLQSKGYGNLGQGNPKNLAKIHENEGLEWAGMPKEMKQVEDAQKNEMGQGNLKE